VLRKNTYPDIEFNYTPYNEHGGISIAVLDSANLQVPEHRAKRGEKTKQEDDDKADLLASADLETAGEPELGWQQREHPRLS
jgi:hypothetical protein